MNLSKLFPVTFMFAIALLSCSSASAKIESIGLGEIVKESDLIVVAHVNKVARTFKPFDFPRYASASVIEVLKGPKLTRISFRATPTWECDTSAATEGETLILFLNREEASQNFFIADSGRGSMRLQIAEGKSFIVLPDDIQAPEGLSVSASDDLPTNSDASIELSTLKVFIGDALASVPDKSDELH